MSQEGLKPVADLQNANIAQALMEEDLQREIARNEAANRMAMQREAQALAARRRAEDSQKMMEDMLAKYEIMKAKLDSTKKHLEETNTKITVQEKLTDKIRKMKERVEAYSNKKEAVGFLNEAVKIKALVTGMEVVEAGKEVLVVPKDFNLAEDNKKDAPKTDVEFKDAVADNRELIDQLKVHCLESQERLKKREQLKELLEIQVEKGEKRAEEQARIAKAREELLELKLRELKLQQDRLARRKEQQRRAEKDNEEFLAQIDRELDEMEKRAGNRNKQEQQQQQPGQEQQEEISRKEEEREAKEQQLARLTEQRKKLEHARDMRIALEQTREKNRVLEQMIAEKKVLMAQQQQKQELVVKGDAAVAQAQTADQKESVAVVQDQKLTEKECAAVAESQESASAIPQKLVENHDAIEVDKIQKTTTKEGVTVVETREKDRDSSAAVSATASKANNGAIPKQKHGAGGKKHNKQSGRNMSTSPTNTTMAAPADLGSLSRASTPGRLLSPDPAPTENTSSRLLSPERGSADAGEGGGESQHPDLSAAVRRIEGKCASVKGNLADMAMSEQYLRTKQALLLAKKKEQEMQIAENIAQLREAEVVKMREKVKHMQELLVQRREKLKLTEAIMKEKTEEQAKLTKFIDAKKRREHYCEKELLERIVFDKEPAKK